MSNWSEKALGGALAGAAGGLIMAMMMREMAPRVLPKEMRPEGFMPKRIVEWAEARAGHPGALTDEQAMRAGMTAHLGYSAAMGTLYSLAREKLEGVPAPLLGALFGLLTWGIGFEGWVPAAGIAEATTEKPVQKWPAPIMGHMIYGVATALTHDVLVKR